MTTPTDPPNSDATAEWSSHRRDAHGDDAVRWTAALVCDQRDRWRTDEPLPFESYLADYPQLSRHPEIGLTLAAHEFLIRAERGESPHLDEYRRRLPYAGDRLAQEIAFLRRHAAPLGSPVRPSLPTRPLPPAPARPQEDRVRDSWPRFPGYELIEELGRGGMAVVYHARQTRLNRSVALKVILSGALAGPDERLRMRREAEAVARLQHPNVVQIYDIGEHDGNVFLSLEYVSGGSLDRRLAAHPLPPEEAAKLVEDLAGAIQAAHDAGIVHRDLKPSNVLLDGNGTPKVTDFGLAKHRDEALKLTATGASSGTPSYMSPEQVHAQPEKIGPATDVYGLGCILYECLTGRPPFDGPTTLETMRQVAQEEVVSVRRLQAAVPRELETACLKCLEKETEKRYATARELAADLRRFRSGEPLQARPKGWLERGWRWARRDPLIPLVILTLLLMTLVVFAMMARSIYHAYQVAGHLRERELYLHGVRGTLLRLDEAQTRYAELAAATADPTWETHHYQAFAKADRCRADAARLSAGAIDAAGLTEAAREVIASERLALALVREGRAQEGWRWLRSEEHQQARRDYAAAVSLFADRVDQAAEEELRQVQSEAFWALASAAVMSGLMGLAILSVSVIAPRAASPRPLRA